MTIHPTGRERGGDPEAPSSDNIDSGLWEVMPKVLILSHLSIYGCILLSVTALGDVELPQDLGISHVCVIKGLSYHPV